ncbi:tail fiber assembly protein [Enterobacter ludwigii]|uniref:tail fiber assembly protein n=1 Tax=Enterobacter ludwigii TaxID=299767 RepID=UPI0039766FD8
MGGFFPVAEKQHFVAASEWPDDGVEVSAAEHDSLFPIPEGKYIGTLNGGPAWLDNPPLTDEQRKARAEAQKSILTDAANQHMNSRQWPGKASLGRLKGDELVQYGKWLDYLDALADLDTSSPDEIIWPEPPEN